MLQISQNVTVLIKIIITLSKPSLLLLVITLGFVDSMKAFNLAYVGMVELCRGQYGDSDDVDGHSGHNIVSRMGQQSTQ